jgi:hypothetical protein
VCQTIQVKLLDEHLKVMGLKVTGLKVTGLKVTGYRLQGIVVHSARFHPPSPICGGTR